MASIPLGPRVLVVEDHIETADLLGRYARLLKFETRICHTGQEALHTAMDFLPQVILLDLGLPDIDGWDLAAALREKLDPIHPVLIAVTGRTTQEDRLRSEQVGIDYHLNKPAFVGHLMPILMQLVGRN